MNQKLAKTIHRYTKKTGLDYKVAKENFKGLDQKSKARLLLAIKNLLN